MPLPTLTEQAVDRVETELRRLDRRLVAHVLDGDSLPTVARVMRPIEEAIIDGTRAALEDIDEDVDDFEVLEAAVPTIEAVEAQVVAAISNARRQRRSVDNVPADRPERERDESLLAFGRRVGTLTAFVAVMGEAANRRRDRVNTEQARRTAQQLRVKLPRRTASHGRMIVRTQTAIERNGHAVKVARRDNLVIYVEDARNGPTDEPCEKVNRKFATPAWLDAHRVEHPNCTRKGTPMLLPQGRRVTLLE